jgi:hypothetical protein
MAQTQTVVASLGSEKEAHLAERVKAGVARLGVGPEAHVRVKLKDKTKLAGYVSKVGDDYFVVTDPETGRASTVAYPDVAQVQGNNLSTKVKIIIAASVIVGVIIVLYIVRGAFCDGC